MIPEIGTQDSAALNQFRTKLTASLLQAKAIVLNCRGKAELGQDEVLEAAVKYLQVKK